MNNLLPETFCFSQSNLQSYQNCPYQFYLRYVLKFKWPAPQTSDVLAFEKDRLAGTRFHQLIHQYYLGIDPVLLLQVAKNDPDLRLSIWFNTFITSIGKNLKGTLFPESSLTIRINDQQLIAKYDLLVQLDNSFTIYDWKTSRKRPANVWLAKQLQSHIFPLVLLEHVQQNLAQTTPDIRMIYWEVSEPDTPYIITYSSEQSQSDKQMVSSLMDQILNTKASDFIRTSDIKHCRYCQYRSHCDRGITAGDYWSDEDIEWLSSNLGEELDEGD
ncbi:MAG: PD-(D/E)XK nuclease family protein [Anaerolineaceae bacterium]